MFKTKFQYYPAKIKSTKPLGECSLKDMLIAIKNPKEDIQETFKAIQKAAEQGDEELKAQLKSTLYYFTPSVNISKMRKYDNIIGFNPIMIAEFDKIDFAKELKEYMFNKFKCIIAAFLSPSGKGVKFIIRIPTPKDIEEYKEYFYGLAYYWSKIKGFDISNQNCVLPLYLSWDSDMLIRKDAIEWDIKGEKINSFPMEPISQNFKKVVTSDRQKQYVLDKICRLYDKIYDNAHPQVITSSLIVGGYVAAGYITDYEAVSKVEGCIRANSYMRKDTNGYLRTARIFIEKGKLSPIYLEEYERPIRKAGTSLTKSVARTKNRP